MTATQAPLSLYHLLDPEVLADPYPLYHRLREEDPVHWDPYLHAWVVTRYADVVHVLQSYSANRTPSPEKLTAMGMAALAPIAQVMTRQMLFLDPPQHTRVRKLAAAAFTPRRVEQLRERIQQVTDELLDGVAARDEADIIEALANPLPAIITAEMFGLPHSDHRQLKQWSEDFAEMLGNFQHNPGRAMHVLRSLDLMVSYFRDAVRAAGARSGGLVQALTTADVDGDRLSEDEVIANLIVTMVGGQETTTNLIGNGLLTLLRQPEHVERLRQDPELMPAAVEELLRYESPSQHTARIAPQDARLGNREIPKGAAVIAVMGAANRDPERFVYPDRLDFERADNRHVAFAWGGHFCFGAPLARIEGQIAFATLLRRFPRLRLQPVPVTWRPNLGLRGLRALPVSLHG